MSAWIKPNLARGGGSACRTLDARGLRRSSRDKDPVRLASAVPNKRGQALRGCIRASPYGRSWGPFGESLWQFLRWSREQGTDCCQQLGVLSKMPKLASWILPSRHWRMRHRTVRNSVPRSRHRGCRTLGFSGRKKGSGRRPAGRETAVWLQQSLCTDGEVRT
jgi:hypothetical protein